MNELLKQCPNKIKNVNCSNGTTANSNVFSVLADSTDRLSTVFSGIREYVNYSPENYSRLKGKISNLILKLQKCRRCNDDNIYA